MSRSITLKNIAFAILLLANLLMLQLSFGSTKNYRETADVVGNPQLLVHSTAAGGSDSIPPPYKDIKHNMCVSRDHDLKRLINKTSNIIIMMPAKAAGTSFKYFAQSCSGQFYNVSDNFLNYKQHINYLTTSYHLPPVISSHLYSDSPAKDVFKHGSEETLFIWSHRGETSRLVSAVKMVMRSYCADIFGKDFQFLENTEERCVISENDLINEVIRKKQFEIRFGTERIVTCGMYNAIRDNLPNLVFIDYKVANEVQDQIARKYCPGQMPNESNLGNGTIYYVRLSRNHTDAVDNTVTLDDWLIVKRSHLEMNLKLKEKITCQATTRRLEHALESCGDHIVKVHDDWIGM